MREVRNHWAHQEAFSSDDAYRALDSHSLIVRPDAAQRQLEREQAAEEARRRQPTDAGTLTSPEPRTQFASEVIAPGVMPPPAVEKKLRRFYGTVELDALRATRDVGTIVQEVIQHLTSLVGADVSVTLEIHAHLPDGAPDHTVRTVTENARTLKFKDFGFEER